MRKEIIFSAPLFVSLESYQGLLKTFEEQCQVHVTFQALDWNNYRSQLVNTAMNRAGADVSAVGAPITSDLIFMDALHPFEPEEIEALGGAGAFLPSRWKSGQLPGKAEVWAIPWLLDYRLLYYWRDMLLGAGINESTAFSDLKALDDTVTRLKKHGLEIPFAPPMQRFGILHAVFSCIWASGGGLFSEDNKQVVFHQDNALRGISAYFHLLQNLPVGYTNPEPDPQFASRRAAIIVGNGSLAQDPSLGDQLGVGLPPGGAYLGGGDLVVWKHTREHQACFDLVKFLVDNAPKLIKSSGKLPTQIRALNNPAGLHPKFGSILSQTALKGHAYPNTPMMGLVEDRLSATLEQIQKDVLSKPASQVDVEELVRSQITSIANRINTSLKAL